MKIFIVIVCLLVFCTSCAYDTSVNSSVDYNSGFDSHIDSSKSISSGSLHPIETHLYNSKELDFSVKGYHLQNIEFLDNYHFILGYSIDKRNSDFDTEGVYVLYDAKQNKYTQLNDGKKSGSGDVFYVKKFNVNEFAIYSENNIFYYKNNKITDTVYYELKDSFYIEYDGFSLSGDKNKAARFFQKNIIIYNPLNGEIYDTLPGEFDSIKDLSWTPDNKMVSFVAPGQDNEKIIICIYDCESKKLNQINYNADAGIFISWDDNNRDLILFVPESQLTDKENQIILFDTETKKETVLFSLKEDEGFRFSYSNTCCVLPFKVNGNECITLYNYGEKIQTIISDEFTILQRLWVFNDGKYIFGQALENGVKKVYLFSKNK